MILGHEGHMTLHAKDSATKFATKPECQAWIDDRVVRFKLRMVKAQVAGSPGETTYVPQKCEGAVISKSIDGFKPSGTDEPLSNYAAPQRDGGVWLAIMNVKE